MSEDLQVWEVVGGGDNGGIIVRAGEDKSSAALERVSTGAFILQLQLKGERLQYEKLTGTGPQTGWVSIVLKDKDLVVKSDKKPITLRFMNPVELDDDGAHQLYCNLYVMPETTIKQAKELCAKKSGLKASSMIPAKGKAGERISEDATIAETKTIAESPLEDGDEFGFIYTGSLEDELIPQKKA
eukprot:gnl/TRDRNA2_/TRDRNA2_181165_c0_seq1.p1 gnl/TRDRNA2_/TRDRNA2_181165_c0~~gnl/TRDRNA2_/TRDRNA2_181165_c0_seq1.p1  ORF type:complete len:198 (-),score=62.87 gnl/TRDRNA2_/TRDRNA2_181165_c0_seq1:63-617(-)